MSAYGELAITFGKCFVETPSLCISLNKIFIAVGGAVVMMFVLYWLFSRFHYPTIEYQ